MKRQCLHDRAAVVTTAILLILDTAQPCELRQSLEACLRDEFVELQRQAIADKELLDA